MTRAVRRWTKPDEACALYKPYSNGEVWPDISAHVAGVAYGLAGTLVLITRLLTEVAAAAAK